MIKTERALYTDLYQQDDSGFEADIELEYLN